MPVKLTPCAKVHRIGRRIVSDLQIVEFYLPLFARVTKVADVDYVEYDVRYGSKQDKLWLQFMFGPTVGGPLRDPEHDSIKWTWHNWGCGGNCVGTDRRGSTDDGRRWRSIAMPSGFAAYQGLPSNAARYFDKILDTMCCGKCSLCKP